MTKGEGSAHLSSCYKGLRELYAEREANGPSIHFTNCRGRNESSLCLPEDDDRLGQRPQRAQRVGEFLSFPSPSFKLIPVRSSICPVTRSSWTAAFDHAAFATTSLACAWAR
jgi:hypothetical protein